MTNQYINLHTGNVWELTADTGKRQEYTRVEDGMSFVGPMPQYFRKNESLKD